MTPAALAKLVRDAHRRIALARLSFDGGFRERLARVMRKDGWLA